MWFQSGPCPCAKSGSIAVSARLLVNLGMRAAGCEVTMGVEQEAEKKSILKNSFYGEQNTTINAQALMTLRHLAFDARVLA